MVCVSSSSHESTTSNAHFYKAASEGNFRCGFSFSPMAALPKLSYVFLSYNRAKYIRAAIKTAFAQDYEGELEYIFSDDCSTDGTFDIIKECVAQYKGHRRVVVTQTPRNLHLAGNTNHALQFVESDWIVRADDDDLATPDRCSIIGKAIAAHPEATFVFNRMETFVDAQEEDIKAKLNQRHGAIPPPRIIDIKQGDDALAEFSTHLCLHQVWSMKHYRQFGPLPADANYVDDVVSLYRSVALGYGVHIDAVTMYIRNGSGNMSRGGDDGNTGYQAIMRLERFNDKYHNVTLPPLEKTVQDVEDYIRQSLTSDEQHLVQAFIDKLKQNLETRRMLCTYWRGSTLNRIRIARKLGQRGVFVALRCLPMPLFAAIMATYRKVKNIF